MSKKSKQVLMNGLELLFLLLSFIFLSLPILRVSGDNMYYTDLNVFNLMYCFDVNFNSTLIATSSLFVVLLTFLSLFTIVPNAILLVASNNNFKVINTIKNTFLLLLLVSYIIFFIVIALFASNTLGGILALIIYLAVVLVAYLAIKFSVKVVKVDNTQTVVCPSCGKRLEENAKFCSECGYNLTNRGICSNCGANLRENAEYCSRCGKKVK